MQTEPYSCGIPYFCTRLSNSPWDISLFHHFVPIPLLLWENQTFLYWLTTDWDPIWLKYTGNCLSHGLMLQLITALIASSWQILKLRTNRQTFPIIKSALRVTYVSTPACLIIVWHRYPYLVWSWILTLWEPGLWTHLVFSKQKCWLKGGNLCPKAISIIVPINW